eukprot:TRINITY_DN3743_c0_g1_i2.p1 TRINITY_DN3743_c0_g1~~TRINITY_DN3743_c0_g1_i2.p1  ORF type:complete len:117 (-),score=32.17 TRINITY_DN3743_c0_g1_i2:253-603(-)
MHCAVLVAVLLCRVRDFQSIEWQFFFFLMIRRPPRSTHCISSAASDVYKRQVHGQGKKTRGIDQVKGQQNSKFGIENARKWASLIYLNILLQNAKQYIKQMCQLLRKEQKNKKEKQ